MVRGLIDEGYTKTDNDKLAALYLSGMSIPEIQEKTEIPQSTIRYRLIKNNITLRTRKHGVQNAVCRGRHIPKGNTKPRTNADREKLSKAKLLWAETNAKGKSLKPSGYIEITRGPNKGKSEHLVIMEAIIGRPLTKKEVVHHIDMNRANNAPDNLQLVTYSEHSKIHYEINKKKGTLRERDHLGRFI